MSNVQAPRSDRDGWKDINKPTAFNLNKRGHLGVVFTSQPSWAWGNKYPRLLQNQLTQEEIPIVHMSIARKRTYASLLPGVIDTSYQTTFHQGPRDKNMENAQFRNV